MPWWFAIFRQNSEERIDWSLADFSASFSGNKRDMCLLYMQMGWKQGKCGDFQEPAALGEKLREFISIQILPITPLPSGGEEPKMSPITVNEASAFRWSRELIQNFKMGREISPKTRKWKETHESCFTVYCIHGTKQRRNAKQIGVRARPVSLRRDGLSVRQLMKGKHVFIREAIIQFIRGMQTLQMTCASQR